MKKIVIGLIVVAVVVLLAAYACGRMKDSADESAGNGAAPNENAPQAPAAEPEKEVAEAEKEAEPEPAPKEEIKEAPAEVKLDGTDKKIAKRSKAPIAPKEATVKSDVKEPAPKTAKPALKSRDDGTNIDQAGVMKVIRASNAAIKRCYDKALTNNPSLKGKIAVKIIVKEDGRVGSVELSEDTLRDADVAKCVKGIIGRLRFPKPEGGPATIVYPYSFTR